MSKFHAYVLLLLFVVPLILFCTLYFDTLSEYTYTKRGVEKGPYGSRPFDKILIHLDLKGAPPLLTYYQSFFPFIRKLGAEGVVIEYEDMFPYQGKLAKLPRQSHYTVQEIWHINKLAVANNLELIPLVQSFGHLEFVLKHPDFAPLRETILADDSICPSDQRSLDLIREMLVQIRKLHPFSTRIHIGADEAYHIAEDARCNRELSKLGDVRKSTERTRAVEILKLRHIARVAQMARDANFSQVFAWNDMFEKSPVEQLKAVKLGSLITPVVWGYAANVLKENYFAPGVFHRLAQVFDDIWFASAFKGANGKSNTYIDVDRYLENHKSYVQLYQKFAAPLSTRVRGIVLTGWQRFNHHLPLCELLPIGIPSLVLNMVYLRDVHRSIANMNREAKSFLNCSVPSPQNSLQSITVGNSTFYPMREAIFADCDFAEKKLFKLIMVDLRFLTWKLKRVDLTDSKNREQLRGKIKILRKELRPELEKYLFPEDVDEFIRQNVVPLTRFIGKN